MLSLSATPTRRSGSSRGDGQLRECPYTILFLLTDRRERVLDHVHGGNRTAETTVPERGFVNSRIARQSFFAYITDILPFNHLPALQVAYRHEVRYGE